MSSIQWIALGYVLEVFLFWVLKNKRAKVKSGKTMTDVMNICLLRAYADSQKSGVDLTADILVRNVNQLCNEADTHSDARLSLVSCSRSKHTELLIAGVNKFGWTVEAKRYGK